MDSTSTDTQDTEKVAPADEKTLQRQAALRLLGKTFWQATGQNRTMYAASLRLVYGDIVTAGLIKPDQGDCGLEIARIYEAAAHTLDGERLWNLANDVLSRLKGLDNDEFHRLNSYQLAVEMASELSHNAIAATRPDLFPSFETEKAGFDSFRKLRGLTLAEFDSVSAAADVLTKMLPIAPRANVRAEESIAHNDLYKKVRLDPLFLAFDLEDTGVFEQRDPIDCALTEVEQDMARYLANCILPPLATDDSATVTDMIEQNKGSIVNVAREHFQYRAARRNLCLNLRRYIALVEADEARRNESRDAIDAAGKGDTQ